MSQPYLAFHHDKEFKPPKSDTEPHLTQALAARRRRRRVVGESMKIRPRTRYTDAWREWNFIDLAKGATLPHAETKNLEPTFDCLLLPLIL